MFPEDIYLQKPVKQNYPAVTPLRDCHFPQLPLLITKAWHLWVFVEFRCTQNGCCWATLDCLLSTPLSYTSRPLLWVHISAYVKQFVLSWVSPEAFFFENNLLIYYPLFNRCTFLCGTGRRQNRATVTADKPCLETVMSCCLHIKTASSHQDCVDLT